MLFRAPLIRLLAFAAAAAGAGVAAAAQVATKSPFLPPAGAGGPAAAATPGAPLEFRGLLDVGSGLQFRLYDPAKKTGTWVKLNERSAELDAVAKQHDPLEETLTIEHQGRTLTLAMRKPKVISAGNAAQMLPPPATPATPVNVAPAVTQTVVLNPTPADEQRRLEAVAAEVARRRALREQATQQLNQAGGAALPAPPPGTVRGPGPPMVQPR